LAGDFATLAGEFGRDFATLAGDLAGDFGIYVIMKYGLQF
jgi:hypothetical protein